MASSIVMLAVCYDFSYKRDVIEVVIMKHSCDDSFCGLYELLFGVSKECIGAPVLKLNKHDGVDWFSYEVHHYCEGGANGVGCGVFPCEPQDIGADIIDRAS